MDELVDTVITKRIDIASLQETNWLNYESRETKKIEYRLWFAEEENIKMGSDNRYWRKKNR